MEREIIKNGRIDFKSIENIEESWKRKMDKWDMV